MTSIAERVQKLVALTASPNENEARNAAMAACKLIREHRLTIGGGPAPDRPEVRLRDQKPPPAGSPDFDLEWFDEMMRSVNGTRARSAAESVPGEGASRWPYYAARAPKSPPPSTMNAPELRTIAEEGLECWQCGERIHVGERAWVSPLRKAMHVGCGW